MYTLCDKALIDKLHLNLSIKGRCFRWKIDKSKKKEIKKNVKTTRVCIKKGQEVAILMFHSGSEFAIEWLIQSITPKKDIAYMS